MIVGLFSYIKHAFKNLIRLKIDVMIFVNSTQASFYDE